MSIDWTNIIKKYKSLWVALKDDEKTVIASGKTAKEALSNAAKKGNSNPILSRVPGKINTYIGKLA
jgi:hypothetical protein